MLTTRIAPTPSGLLHLGNAVNFLLNQWLAQAAGGRLLLRVDDIDTARRRPEYLADIFATIAALGLQVSDGPTGTADFLAHHSQTLRLTQYRAALRHLVDSGFPMYPCPCSRRDLAGLPRDDRGQLLGHLCRDGGREFIAGSTTWRARTEPELGDWVGEHGDFVIWRRDDLPSYQLTSVVDDQRLGITHIVRGADLRAATGAQLWLAAGLDARGVLDATYIHHRLLLGPAGQKLSKSAGANSVRALVATPSGLEQIHAAARVVAAEVGIPAPPS